MAIESPIISSWNYLNSLLGKSVYTIEWSNWKNPNVFRRFAQKKYLLTPEEVTKFEVQTNAGPGKRSYLVDPRRLDPLKARDEYQVPNYWFVNTPFWAGGDRIVLLERIGLDKNLHPTSGYVHKLGEVNNLPVLFYDLESHRAKGATCNQIESLLERLSEVGIETITTPLTP